MGVRFARPSLVMQALRLLLLTLMASVASASTSFQSLDRVEGWLIERLSLIHISEPRDRTRSRMPSSA